MTNRVMLTGKVLAAPKIRSYKRRGKTIEIVSLWIRVRGDERADSFTVEVTCAKAAAVAKAMREGVRVEIDGVLRHDRWPVKGSADEWAGKIYVSIEPGGGALRSHGPDAADAA